MHVHTYQILWGGAWERLTNFRHTYVNKRKHFPGDTAECLFIINSPHTHKGSHPLISMQRLQGAIIHSPTFQHLSVLTGRGSVRHLLASSAAYASAYYNTRLSCCVVLCYIVSGAGLGGEKHHTRGTTEINGSNPVRLWCLRWQTDLS